MPLFRNAIIGGSLFRIGIGAFPFLMPLMLQLDLRPDARSSAGSSPSSAAFGAISSKFVAERLYATLRLPARADDRRASAPACCSPSTAPSRPTRRRSSSMLVAARHRRSCASFFFTGVNALGFADVDEHEASQATAINAVSQQLSIALGVAVAGGVLELSSSLHRRRARPRRFPLSPGSSSPASRCSAPSPSCACRPTPAATSPATRSNPYQSLWTRQL